MKRIVAKFVACGAVTLTIAWALVTFGPDGEVQESKADVWEIGMFERSNTQKFASSLKRLGHEPPRSYDVNGNKVFFSVRATNKRPLELVEEYQRTFVEEGLNTEEYGFQKRANEKAERLLGGQILPLKMTNEVMTMGGVVVADSPSSVEEWNSMKESYRNRPLHDAFVGYRHIQADWDADAKTTFVTATWSDEEFDMRRISGASDDRVPEETEVPTCIGCKKLVRWETDTRDVPYTINTFISPQDSGGVANFYTEAMQARGWKLEMTTMHRRKPGDPQMLEFARGEDRLQISVVPEGARNSRVITVQME